MQKQFVLLLATLFFSFNVFPKTEPELPLKNAPPLVTIAFTENKGQVHDQHHHARPDVLYGVMAGNMAVHIKNNGVSYQLFETNSSEGSKEKQAQKGNKGFFMNSEHRAEQIIYRIDLNWLNYNPNFTVTQDETLPGYNNYYLESCPNGALNVKSYTGITLRNLYDGINLHYYQKNGELKHDYIVAPHANYKQIELMVAGSEISLDNDGSLIFNTPLGKVQEGAPVVYQNGKKLKARWLIQENGFMRKISFDIDNYDADSELIIDPVTRVWGTYYGGTGTGINGNDEGVAVCNDLNGNAYLAGFTTSASGTIIATVGSHQAVYGGSNGDAFLAKFNFFGTRLWATYYGGSAGDTGGACACDGAGNVYLVGSTFSGSAIATPGSHQTIYQGGGSTDAFVVKFNAGGVRQWSSYYGGNNYDAGLACSTDTNNNVYIAGHTNSTTNTLIASPGSYQPTFNGSYYIGFLAKFSSSGVRQWGTFYGTGGDFLKSCATDPFGNVFIAGRSESTGTVIATPGSHQSANALTGTFDAFLAKFNTNGVRQWGTFYGGLGVDEGNYCATDASGNVYLAGSSATSSGTIIATAGSHQSAWGGLNDAFLVKFDGSGVRQWATYYGGTANDIAYSCMTDASSNVYLSGQTATSNSLVISTVGSHQSVFAGGASDAFLIKFNSAGIRQWGTYYGGAGDEGESGTISHDPFGNVYLSGTTTSSVGSAIATANGHQASYAGRDEAFLVKFDVCETAPVQPTVVNLPAAVCESITASYNAPLVFGGNSYTWSFPSGWTWLPGNNTITATPGISGVISLTAGNACGISQHTLNVTVNPLPTVAVNSGTVCASQPFTITASGAATYTYSSGPVITPTVNGSYSVTGTSAAGCISSNTAVASVTVYPLPQVLVTSGTVCAGGTFTISASGANTYSYSNGAVVSPGFTSTYSVTGTDLLGCAKTVVSTVVVNSLPVISVNSGAICLGQTFTLIPTGATSYTYSGGPVVSPTTTTSYSITGTNSGGCLSSNTAVSTVTVSNIHPTITVNSGAICFGKSFTITPTGASTYTIQGGSAVVTPISTSNYTVAGTSTAGCLSSNTVIASVTVNLLPIISLASSSPLICEGETVTLTASGASTYTFNPGGTGASIVVSPNVTTNYQVSGTDANGCKSTSSVTQDVDACLGVRNEKLKIKNDALVLYPNPTNGVINLESKSDIEIFVISALGQPVYFTTLKAGKQQIGLGHLPKGMYVLRAGHGTGLHNFKILLE